MANAPFKLRDDYWEIFQLESKDLEFLYNHLLELEIPLTSLELTEALVTQRIEQEILSIQNRQMADGKIYLPKEQYEPGDNLFFPALDWQKGKVINVRDGTNPNFEAFQVIELEMLGGTHREFAAGLPEHKLNQPVELAIDDTLLDYETVMARYGPELVAKLDKALEDNQDLVRIAARWFPTALLVDVNIGHLNLAEAALDMVGGGPLFTRDLLDQIELPTDVNTKLTEFSLNYALQEDQRFDEVGAAGEVVWYLNRLEPDAVRETPRYLQFSAQNYDRSALTETMVELEEQLDDDLVKFESQPAKLKEATISLIYPHWRSGTIPLTKKTMSLFPTAFESPRIRFTLIDADSGDKFPGWVVRNSRYIFGLSDWYKDQGVIPGSLIHIEKGKKPGEVFIQAEKRRSNREWIRTILVGADGGIVFAMLKQMVTAAFDERMAIAVPDVDSIDQVWKRSSNQKSTLLQSVLFMMRELAKLNTQGHVHAQELYAALNVIRRCPPAPLLTLLSTQTAFIHVGDLYFRLDEDQ